MAVKKWRGKWVVDLNIDGKRVRRTSPVQTKRGAQRYEAELLLGSSTGTFFSGGDAPIESPTLAEFAPEWLMTYAVVNNRPSERVRKEHTLRNHLVPFFGKLRLDQITPRRIEAYKANRLRRGLKPRTINLHLAVLQKLLRCAVEWNQLLVAPKVRRLPTAPPEFDWLRPDETRRLLDAARARSFRWYVFFFIAVRTGLRKGELIALHWSEIDLENRRLTVKYSAFRGELGPPKSGKTRVLPMTTDLVSTMRRWREQSTGPLVFPTGQGRIMRSTSLPCTALNSALSDAGLRHIRFHDLRHTFASHLVLKRCSLREVQLLMGHQSVRVTERYAHLESDQLATAVDVLDGLGSPSAEDAEEER